MRNPLSSFRLRFSTVHVVVAAALAPLLIVLFLDTRHERWGIALVALTVVLALITFRGRRLSGWVSAMFCWLWLRRRPLQTPSEPIVGAMVMPGDHVAVRWQGGVLVASIELRPNPFTPTVIVDGRARSDDVVDTRLVERLLSVHCPDLEADVVSAGYRIGSTSSAAVRRLYEEAIGSDPAPAHRRTWILMRADPLPTRTSAQWRDSDVAGLIRYLVASTTRIADALARHGIDASCERSFDDYDHATDIHFERERWSTIKGRNTFTAAYTAPGGPHVWWAAPADHTITRFRIAAGAAPRSTVLLTTPTKSKKPRGFSRVSLAQRAALQGQTLVTDRHWQLPIGSAGVLLGQTTRDYPIYMPFDDVDVAVDLDNARTFTQFAVRASAAGGIVTLPERFRQFAELIGVQIGPEAKVAWPHATTFLGHHPGVDRVDLRHNLVGTPRRHRLPIRQLSAPEEIRYELTLPRGRHGGATRG